MPLMKRGTAPVADRPPETGVVTTSTIPPATAPKKLGAPAKAGSDTMSKAEWREKDERISRQGLFQAALQSTGLLQLNTGNTLEAYLKLVEQTADRGIEYVNRHATKSA